MTFESIQYISLYTSGEIPPHGGESLQFWPPLSKFLSKWRQTLWCWWCQGRALQKPIRRHNDPYLRGNEGAGQRSISFEAVKGLKRVLAWRHRTSHTWSKATSKSRWIYSFMGRLSQGDEPSMDQGSFRVIPRIFLRRESFAVDEDSILL